VRLGALISGHLDLLSELIGAFAAVPRFANERIQRFLVVPTCRSFNNDKPLPQALVWSRSIPCSEATSGR